MCRPELIVLEDCSLVFIYFLLLGTDLFQDDIPTHPFIIRNIMPRLLIPPPVCTPLTPGPLSKHAINIFPKYMPPKSLH